jgi:hypothetical protein
MRWPANTSMAVHILGLVLIFTSAYFQYTQSYSVGSHVYIPLTASSSSTIAASPAGS